MKRIALVLLLLSLAACGGGSLEDDEADARQGIQPVQCAASCSK